MEKLDKMVAFVNKAFGRIAFTILVLVPISLGIYQGRKAYSNSEQTAWIVEYWAPQKSTIITEIPESAWQGVRLPIDNFSTFTNAFADRPMLVQPGFAGVQYYVTVGNGVTFYSTLYEYKNLNSSGLTWIRMEQVGNGQVKLIGERSWLMIILSSIFKGAILIGGITDIILCIIGVVVAFFLVIVLAKIAASDTPWCKKLTRILQGPPDEEKTPA